MTENQQSKREFLKTAAYVVPCILTLKAVPAFAGSGSGRVQGNNGVGNGEDPQPPGNPPVNDGPWSSPGNPGNRGGPENKVHSVQENRSRIRQENRARSGQENRGRSGQ
jgi:hypothetical protein